MTTDTDTDTDTLADTAGTDIATLIVLDPTMLPPDALMVVMERMAEGHVAMLHTTADGLHYLDAVAEEDQPEPGWGAAVIGGRTASGYFVPTVAAALEQLEACALSGSTPPRTTPPPDAGEYRVAMAVTVEVEVSAQNERRAEATALERLATVRRLAAHLGVTISAELEESATDICPA